MQSWQRKEWFVVYLEIIWRWWRHDQRQQLCRRDRQQLSVKSWPLSSVIAKIESGLRNSIANLFSPAGNCLQSPLETEDDLLLFCKVSSDAFFCWNNIVNNCCCHGNGYMKENSDYQIFWFPEGVTVHCEPKQWLLSPFQNWLAPFFHFFHCVCDNLKNRVKSWWWWWWWWRPMRAFQITFRLCGVCATRCCCEYGLSPKLKHH